MTNSFPRARVDTPTYRLVPSRFPPISAFETVASAADLELVLELEGWTNDRLVVERLARLDQSEWVYGVANASVVMASFLHAASGGLRFTSGDLGGWYAATSIETAVAEVSHHLRREAANAGMPEFRGEYRTYKARIDGEMIDIRGADASHPGLYSKASYTDSQAFGEATRAAGETGIIFDSVRHVGGTNVVAYRPKRILDVTQADHYELLVPVVGKIVVRRLAA